jgi:hypothetical protein
LDRVSFLRFFFMRFSRRPPPRLYRLEWQPPKKKGVRGVANRVKASLYNESRTEVQALPWAMAPPSTYTLLEKQRKLPILERSFR